MHSSSNVSDHWVVEVHTLHCLLVASSFDTLPAVFYPLLRIVPSFAHGGVLRPHVVVLACACLLRRETVPSSLMARGFGCTPARHMVGALIEGEEVRGRMIADVLVLVAVEHDTVRHGLDALHPTLRGVSIVPPPRGSVGAAHTSALLVAWLDLLD